MTGRAADDAAPVPIRRNCDACGGPTAGKWMVRFEDGTWKCQDCLTENQRRVWLRIVEGEK